MTSLKETSRRLFYPDTPWNGLADNYSPMPAAREWALLTRWRESCDVAARDELAGAYIKKIDKVIEKSGITGADASDLKNAAVYRLAHIVDELANPKNDWDGRLSKVHHFLDISLFNALRDEAGKAWYRHNDGDAHLQDTQTDAGRTEARMDILKLVKAAKLNDWEAGVMINEMNGHNQAESVEMLGLSKATVSRSHTSAMAKMKQAVKQA